MSEKTTSIFEDMDFIKRKSLEVEVIDQKPVIPYDENPNTASQQRTS